MSNSNIFTYGNFQQTPINDAYQFNSFSRYINDNKLKCKFSPVCVFCSSNNSTSLTNDGSFRHCNKCKKTFKSTLIY